MGNGLKGNRKTGVQWYEWLMVAAVGCLIAFAFRADAADPDYDRALVAVNPHPERGEIGHLFMGTDLCQTDSINSASIVMLNQWTALIMRLEAVGRDASLLSQEDNILGSSLMTWCGTLGEGYDVRYYKGDGDYALIVFLNSYGFEPLFHIIRVVDFWVEGSGL